MSRWNPQILSHPIFAEGWDAATVKLARLPLCVRSPASEAKHSIQFDNLRRRSINIYCKTTLCTRLILWTLMFNEVCTLYTIFTCLTSLISVRKALFYVARLRTDRFSMLLLHEKWVHRVPLISHVMHSNLTLHHSTRKHLHTVLLHHALSMKLDRDTA